MAGGSPLAAAAITKKVDPAAKPETRYEALDVLARGMYSLNSLYVDEDKVKMGEMASRALQGIIAKLDPHTVLMSKKAFEQLTTDVEGKFGGVGLIVSQVNNKLMVVSPIEDTPAARAGVKAGDEIIAIDGKEVTPSNGTDTAETTRGEPGSSLRLTVRRPGVEQPVDFDLVREIIKVRSVHGQTLAPGIQYAHLSSFQETTGQELKDFMEAHKTALRGMVLDLRDNPGGLVDQAVRVCDLFIDSGVIVSTVGRDRSRVEREFASKRGAFTGFPLIVLVNGGSASAAEIVAGALQDHERGLIMGTTTFGKGSVQTFVSLPDGSGLKLTVARYYTPKDRAIQAKGIEPDIVVRPARKPADVAAANGAARPDSGRTYRKESDLEGHITSTDLVDQGSAKGKGDGTSETASWPEALRGDKQLLTAFTYLKSWAHFERQRMAPAAVPAAPGPG